MKKVLCFCLAALMVLSITGCKKSKEEKTEKNDYPITVSGVKFTKSPENVVVLSDSLADIVLAEGYELKLKGRTTDCTQNELSILPEVGSKEQPDINKIKGLSADLVLTDTKLHPEIEAELQTAKIPVLTFARAETREEIEALYTDLGSVLGGAKTGAEKGKKSADSILLTLDDINRIIPETDVLVTACYLYDDAGKVATGDTFEGKLIEFSGATNIARDGKDNNLDSKTIRLSDPMYIFCATGVKEKLNSNETLSGLTAVQEDRVFELGQEILLRQGRSMIESVSFMAGTMFPEITNKGTTISSAESSSSVSFSSDASSAVSEITIQEGMSIPYGEQSDNVMAMEQRLDELNYMPTIPDGVFDESTKRAVTDFQYLNNLEATGEANEATLRLLFSENATARPDPSREK